MSSSSSRDTSEKTSDEINVVIAQVEDALECGICYCLISDAMVTVCGHTYCMVCILRWLEGKDSCPICNAQCRPVHPNWVVRNLCTIYKQAGSQGMYQHVIHTPEQLRERGNESYRRHEYADAVRSYSLALEQVQLANQTADYRLYSNRAQCFVKLGLYRAARDDFNAAIKLEPTFTKAHVRLAQVCLELNEPESVILTHVQNAERLDGKNAFPNELADLRESAPMVNRKRRAGSTPNSTSNSARSSTSNTQPFRSTSPSTSAHAQQQAHPPPYSSAPRPPPSAYPGAYSNVQQGIPPNATFTAPQQNFHQQRPSKKKRDHCKTQ